MDMMTWLEYFVGGLATQLEEVKVRGERVIRRDVLANMHHLNPRQTLMIELFAEKDAARILVKAEGSVKATRYVLSGGAGHD